MLLMDAGVVPSRVDVALVCGGRFHDFDYARVQLLIGLQQWPNVRTSVYTDYEFMIDRRDWQMVVSYTCDVRPSRSAEQALVSYVSNGGRWIGLHGTNAALETPDIPGPVVTPNANPDFYALLGSRFVAHPPVHEYLVSPTDISHPLTEGVEAFTVRDELYCSEMNPPVETLLATRFEGSCPSFAGEIPAGPDRPVLYLKHTGSGTVCYCTLGHCRGLVDTLELPHIEPSVDRGSWEEPMFRRIIERALAWGLTRPTGIVSNGSTS